MFNTTREKTLAVILAGSVVAIFGYEAFNHLFLTPTRAVRTQVQTAAERNKELQFDFSLIEHAQKNLHQARGISLPSDPPVASLVYQDWLLDQVKKAGMPDAVVTPGQPIPEESVGHRIPFTIQATANLRQIGRILDSFYAAPVLHRITFMTISNAGSSSASQRKLVLSLEGLALRTATAQDSMPRPQSTTTRVASARLEYHFSRNDPFRRTVIKPIRNATVAITASDTHLKSARPKVDELKTIRLVASVVRRGQPEAWFFDTRTDREFIVTVGETLQTTEFSGRVTSIDADSITVASHDRSLKTKLGETLRESIAQAVN